jgi:ABC-type transport system involved in cytochrome c biogenesis permease subunit
MARAAAFLPAPAGAAQDGAVANPVLVLVAACYAAVATAYLEARRRREPAPRWARVLGVLGVAAHLAGLYALSGETGRSPFASGAQSLSFVAFALGALYLVLEATSRVATHGGGFYAVVTLLTALSVPGLLAAPTAATAMPHDALRTVHVGLSLLSAAAVLAGGLLALGYLQAYRRVKRRSLEAGEPGPSLSGFERLERRASGVSVLLLLPALWLGLDVALRSDAPRGLLALAGLTAVLLLLLVVAGFLWWRRPRRGALAAWLNVTATVLLLVAVLAVHPLVRAGTP